MPASQVGNSLRTPPRATGDDVRIMIEEKPRTMGKNPLNIQVVVDGQEEVQDSPSTVYA